MLDSRSNAGGGNNRISRQNCCKGIDIRSGGDKAWSSPRSWNSRLGVPVSLLEVPADASVALVECGIDRAGDMEAIEKIVKPDLGILTSITDEHDNGFSSREEKSERSLSCSKTYPY